MKKKDIDTDIERLRLTQKMWAGGYKIRVPESDNEFEQEVLIGMVLELVVEKLGRLEDIEDKIAGDDLIGTLVKVRDFLLNGYFIIA